MLYISTSIVKYNEFFSFFKEKFKDLECIDLSKILSINLADECMSIVDHHKECCVFLGYLEPGWMLEPQNQTKIRKLFRKFPVATVTYFTESLPYSWKTEIEVVYTFKE